MRKLVVFNQVTLDGYFTGEKGDLSWAHANHDAEWNAFVAGNAKSGGQLLFGRITYEMMVQYWPTPMAAKNDPVVAERMNNLPKVVFSNTMDKPTWKNTKVVKGDIATRVRALKNEPGEHMTILGSGSIVSQLAQTGLIDEYQLVLNPVVLGKGRTLFEGIEDKIEMQPTSTRIFANGNILMCYIPAA